MKEVNFEEFTVLQTALRVAMTNTEYHGTYQAHGKQLRMMQVELGSLDLSNPQPGYMVCFNNGTPAEYYAWFAFDDPLFAIHEELPQEMIIEFKSNDYGELVRRSAKTTLQSILDGVSYKDVK